MEIWVRSQNQKWFGKMGEMYIAKDDNGEWAIVHSGGAALGYYESEERCIKILTELQDTILKYIGNPIVILNMPKE